jgi:hypothetical protein
VHGQFTDEEVEVLMAAVAAINAWNRLNVGLRTVPGDYQPRDYKADGGEAAARCR